MHFHYRIEENIASRVWWKNNDKRTKVISEHVLIGNVKVCFGYMEVFEEGEQGHLNNVLDLYKTNIST